MITEELTSCPKCMYMRALTHWSNSYEIQWTACPNCLSFYDHGDEQKEYSTEFWSHVMKDTGYD